MEWDSPKNGLIPDLVWVMIAEYETIADVIWKGFEVSLPGMKRRDATLMRMWVPDFLSKDRSSGKVSYCHLCVSFSLCHTLDTATRSIQVPVYVPM